MGNYSLVIDSRFKPFSYQEMLAPALMATQAHQELENQYSELATKANIWDEMANKHTDPYAYKMYKTYANDLKNQADQLARAGLNATSRRDMLNMRERYSKEITPIEQAYAARQKQAEQQQQALLQDPTLMLSRRAATTSLDDYIRNPQLAYDTYSGKLITAQAAQAASALAKEMQEKPRKWRSILNDSYYEALMQKGFSSQAVLQAIQDNPNAAPELLKIVEDAVSSSGIKDWNNPMILKRAYDYAKQGLWSAVGETQYQTLDNWRAKMAAQEAAQIRAENRAIARENNRRMQVIGAETRPIDLFAVNKNKELHNFIDKKFLKKDPKTGQLKATPHSREEYIKFVNKCKELGISIKQGQKLSNMTTEEANKWISANIKNKFKRDAAEKAFGSTLERNTFGARVSDGTMRLAGQYAAAIDEMYNISGGKAPLIKYGSKDNVTYGYQPGNIGNLFTQYTGGRPTKISATTGWQYSISPSQSPQAINNLVSALGTTSDKFSVVNYVKGKYKQTGTFNKSKLTDKDYDAISYISNDNIDSGVVIEIRGKGNKSSEHFFIEVPSSDPYAKNIKKIFKNQKVYTQIYGKDPSSSNWANEMYKSGVSDIYSNMASMIRTNTAQEQTFQSAGTPLFGDMWGNSESQEEE